MKISGTPSIQNVKSSQKKKSGQGSSDGGAFDALMESQSSGETAAPKQTAPVGSVAAVLGLQEVSDEETSRKAYAKRGHNILEQLDAIRHGLLLGTIPRERLERIRMQLREQKPHITDPALLGIMSEIELRAEVELAKWEKFS